VPTMMRALQERVAVVPGVQEQPAPGVEVVEFTPLGPVLGVGVFCKPTQAGPTQAAVAQAVAEILMASGYAVPQQTAQQLLAKAG
ncbi:MAG TPA: mechanosensitive ion channel family protein, partial [Archangium sp.]|nr:mechanosensitive ion channel family protein [Archangium sp.]